MGNSLGPCCCQLGLQRRRGGCIQSTSGTHQGKHRWHIDGVSMAYRWHIDGISMAYSKNCVFLESAWGQDGWRAGGKKHYFSYLTILKRPRRSGWPCQLSVNTSRQKIKENISFYCMPSICHRYAIDMPTICHRCAVGMCLTFCNSDLLAIGCEEISVTDWIEIAHY